MRTKAMLAAGILIAQAVTSPFAIARMGQTQAAGELAGFVVPNEVGANEAFTFAATNVVAGEVVEVKTLEGEVVATKKSDKHGRVFLAAGLAAGAYLLSAKGGKSTSSLNVQPPRPPMPGTELTIPNLPGAVNAAEGLNLSGTGMSPNAADMTVRIGKTEFPVLAGTATEMKTGPLPASACGNGPVEVQNNQTGATSNLGNVVCYQLSAKLSRTKLTSGEAARLEFTFQPANLTAAVEAQILSGPVSFAGGARNAAMEIVNGAGHMSLHADKAGQGPFRVAYNIHEILGAGKTSLTGPLAKPGGVGGENPEKADNRQPRCPLTKHIRDEATGWDTSEKKVADPANPGKTKTIYIASRTIRCSIHKSCSKREGHAGDCAFTGKSRCKDHDKIETREYDSNEARKDGMKDTAIPAGLRNP